MDSVWKTITLSGCMKVMDTVLSGVHGARAYIDDVVVYTQTWEEHLKVLELTLQALAKHGFKIKLKKCHFGGDLIVGTTMVVKY